MRHPLLFGGMRAASLIKLRNMERWMARRRLPRWLGGPRHVLPLSDALGLECKRTSRCRGNSGDADNRDALRGYRPKVSPHERIHIVATRPAPRPWATKLGQYDPEGKKEATHERRKCGRFFISPAPGNKWLPPSVSFLSAQSTAVPSGVRPHGARSRR